MNMPYPQLSLEKKKVIVLCFGSRCISLEKQALLSWKRED